MDVAIKTLHEQDQAAAKWQTQMDKNMIEWQSFMADWHEEVETWQRTTTGNGQTGVESSAEDNTQKAQSVNWQGHGINAEDYPASKEQESNTYQHAHARSLYPIFDNTRADNIRQNLR